MTPIGSAPLSAVVIDHEPVCPVCRAISFKAAQVAASALTSSRMDDHQSIKRVQAHGCLLGQRERAARAAARLFHQFMDYVARQFRFRSAGVRRRPVPLVAAMISSDKP